MNISGTEAFPSDISRTAPPGRGVRRESRRGEKFGQLPQISPSRTRVRREIPRRRKARAESSGGIRRRGHRLHIRRFPPERRAAARISAGRNLSAHGRLPRSRIFPARISPAQNAKPLAKTLCPVLSGSIGALYSNCIHRDSLRILAFSSFICHLTFPNIALKCLN